LLRRRLASGPKCVEHIEAAAEAAEIGEHALIAAADALGVMARKGTWRLCAAAMDHANIAASLIDQPNIGRSLADPANM
jgi:hypothetical protein